MIPDISSLEQDLRAVYGAYAYLRAHDLVAVSTTSRLLRDGDLSFLAGRVRDELDELDGTVAGTHGHGNGRADVVLEAYQSLYWLLLLAVAGGDIYDEARPHEALVAGGEGVGGVEPQPLPPSSAEVMGDATRRRRFLRVGFGLVGARCRRGGVDVAAAVARDLAELRGKPYLAPYWAAPAGDGGGGNGGGDEDGHKVLRARPRATVAGMAPYVPGRAAEEVRRRYGLDIVVKLASNENPFGASPRAVAAAEAALSGVNRYPDGAATALRDRLAALFALDRANVVVGNGSDEVITLLALAYLAPGDEAVLADPPYSIHRNATLIAGGVPVGVPLRARHDDHDLPAMAAAVTDRTRLLFVANPHNPTGTVVPAAALRDLLAAIPARVLVVVDEAYHDYVDDGLRWTARDLLDAYPNVATLRTFSKAHGLAGLRAGYALVDPEVGATLDRIRPPFGLNLAAQAAALAALDDPAHVAHVVAANRDGRARLLDIARRHGLDAIESQANFALMRAAGAAGSGAGTGASGDSAALVEALLRRGVIVRPGENLGAPGWIRVSVGAPDDLDRFERALDDVLDGELA